MGDRANFVVVDGRGLHGPYVDKYGAVRLDVTLLAGPERVLARAGAFGPGYWLDDVMCQGAALVDVTRRVLLFFLTDGPSTDPRTRDAMFALLQEAWPGWELRWCWDGNADLRRYLGLDPEAVRDRAARYWPASPIAEDREIAPEEPMLAVVTIGSQRCHLLPTADDHPVCEGPGLIDRLAAATDFTSCEVAAEAGLHLDPERRTVGWWTLANCPRADEIPARWPGWEVTFWRDDRTRHLSAAPGVFALPPVDPAWARATILGMAGS